MASRTGAQTVEELGAMRRRAARLAQAGKIGGAFLGAALAALMVAGHTQAQDQPQTANQLRYQYDAYYHIVYYSPEAFECFRPGNQKNIGLAIATTQKEIQRLGSALAELTSAGSSSEDIPSVAALTEMIAHLKDILSRLLRLPPCPEQPTEAPVTPGPLPPDGGTGAGSDGGPDQSGGSNQGGDDTVVPQGDLGGTGQNGQFGQGASPCWPGSNASDQGNCPQDQYGLNRPNQHGDNGNGHHNNH